jgi:glutaredoxin-related protein
VYVDKEFLGGSDILMAMHQSGELAEVFGVPQPKAE